ncbi:MAG: hypothetical protein GXW93_02255 [Pseudomonas lactis]|nr:hypothetical protein [Pseudomonas lactis]
MPIEDEKKPADQAGLGCPANSAGLYVGAQQTLGTPFNETTFLQAISAAFSQTTFLQAISAAFSQTTFLQAIRATFGNTGFYQAIRAAFSDNRVGKSVCSEYRESEAKQDLAFHDGVLRVFKLGAVWHGFDVTRCIF